MTDHQQNLEKLKQLFQEKFPQVEPEPLAPLETIKYAQLRSFGQKVRQETQLIRFQAATRIGMKPIDNLVLEALRDGEIRVSELHSKLEGYSTDQRLESFLFLLEQGLITKTETGFKLTTPTPLYQIEESLKEALPRLEQARNLMHFTHLHESYTHLFKCITDAVQATTDAIAHTSDAPDN